MINERRDFETLDATRLTLLSLLFQREARYMCVEVQVDFERKEMPETNKRIHPLLFILWIFVFNYHLHFCLTEIEFTIDQILQRIGCWILIDFCFLETVNLNFLIIILNENIIKRDLERTNGFQETMSYRVYRVWGPGSLQLLFRSLIARHLTRANMIYEVVSITIAFQ